MAEERGLEVPFEEVEDAPAGRPAVPEPRPLEPGDQVPLFRADLKVVRGASASLFDVSDPVSGRKFTLYEFELAIARMLDGRRTAAEVVASGARLGIPMDVGALYKFVRQMWHYGFLAPAGAPQGAPGPEATWAARENWDDATRTLFQTGQRLMRGGRPADAASYFEAVLDAHPENAEAAELLALIAKGQALPPGPPGEVPRPGEPGAPAPAPSGAAPAPPRRRRAPLAAGAAVAAALLAGGAVLALRRPPPPPAAAPPAPAAAAPGPAPAAPAPVWRTGPVERRLHPALADVTAPEAGTVVWRAAPDAAVERGQALGVVRFAVTAARKGDAALARRVAELEKLAAKDPVYRDFLAKARSDQRRAARRQARQVKEAPILAPAAGRLVRGEAPAGEVAAGDPLARVVDPARWHLTFAVDGEPPEDAGCVLVGDAPSERARCRVVARTRAGGRLDVVAEVGAADAPWLSRSAAPLVRLVPPALAAPAAPASPAAPAPAAPEPR